MKTMGKVIFGINMTIDGCCDHTKGKAGADVHQYFADLMRSVDVIAYGRKTYELMVPFWPDIAKSEEGPASIVDFAKAFDSVGSIVVFSRTLQQVDNAKTTIVSTSPIDEIKRLKAEDKRISLGGVDVPGQLIAAGVVDEYHIVVQPVVAGEGRRLMDGINLPEQLELKLKEAKVLESGCVALRYVRGY